MKDVAEARAWVIRAIGEQLSGVLETMAGECPLVESSITGDPPVGDVTYWTVNISVAPGGVLTLGATRGSWFTLGGKVLAAAGLELDDDETIRSTFQETVDQAFSGMAQSATALLAREVTTTPSRSTAFSASSADVWSRIEMDFADGKSAALFFLCNDPMLSGFVSEASTTSRPAPAAGSAEPNVAAAPVTHYPATPPVRNADLLFDVELPVAVSFGRAHLQLRDVMKLTTGSIVELNRSISEPVEVIVNNCVIARGEVVVVEGNFGVRVREVISRQERLRTLH